MTIEGFLKSNSEETVVYRYLEMLAGRITELESKSGLEELAKLRAENQGLRMENRHLRTQLIQRDGIDIEKLVTFLPAIFRNFWGTVRPDELAMLAGTLNIPQIPSPCPEPSAETIGRMKRYLFSLPPEERARIIEFAQMLPYKLQVRSEFQGLWKEEHESR